jgi:uncharacterized protein GlcG (DUF336 family)
MISFPSLDMNDALSLQLRVIEQAHTDGLKPVAVCIVDARGEQLSAACMDGVKPPSILTAHAKAVTVVRFQRATVQFCNVQSVTNPELWVPLGLDGWDDEDIANAMKINPTFCSWPGGVPVFAHPEADIIVGAIGVSNRTAMEDHQLASKVAASF